tara:strand:- start:2032 stop:2664 length:633 start_codon:yes stop_codon:yes gene_type:complete
MPQASLSLGQFRLSENRSYNMVKVTKVKLGQRGTDVVAQPLTVSEKATLKQHANALNDAYSKLRKEIGTIAKRQNVKDMKRPERAKFWTAVFKACGKTSERWQDTTKREIAEKHGFANKTKNKGSDKRTNEIVKKKNQVVTEVAILDQIEKLSIVLATKGVKQTKITERILKAYNDVAIANAKASNNSLNKPLNGKLPNVGSEVINKKAS